MKTEISQPASYNMRHSNDNLTTLSFNQKKHAWIKQEKSAHNGYAELKALLPGCCNLIALRAGQI